MNVKITTTFSFGTSACDSSAGPRGMDLSSMKTDTCIEDVCWDDEPSGMEFVLM